MGSWGSRARQVLKEYVPKGRQHVAEMALGGRILATIRKKGSEALPSRRSLGENDTAADRDARAAVGLLPRRRRQRERCTYTPTPVEVVRPDL